MSKSNALKRKGLQTLGALVFCSLAVYFLVDEIYLISLGFWVARYPHRTIKLIAYDDAGRRLGSVDFFRTWRPALIVRDLNGSPRFGMQYGLGIPKVAVAPGEVVQLDILWPVPGFGKIVLVANNEGKGYRVGYTNDLRLELVPELARSQLAALRQWIDRHNAGSFASAEAEAENSAATLSVHKIEDCQDVASRASVAAEALTNVLRAGEHEIMAESRRSIERNRRGQLEVQVEDQHGRPLPRTRVKFAETKPDFQFGVFSDGYDPATIARLKFLGLDYAELFMTWNRTEPAPGTFSFKQFDTLFDPAGLAENDFTLCGHAVVWLANGEVPSYMNPTRGNRDALIAAVREHVSEIVNHYKSQVKIWEAINEGHTAWARWGLDDDSIVEVVRTASEEIHRNAPGAKVRIEVTLPLGEDVALKHYPLISAVSLGRIGDGSEDAYQFAKRLIDRNVPYDILALQFYNGARVNISGGVQVPSIDLLRFAEELERYATLGKPIQVAEVAVGSTHRYSFMESWWHEPANEQTQADYLEGVFTVAYGEPKVEGINWWGLYDKYRFVENGGLFDNSGREKPSAVRLRNLIQGWLTRGEAQSDRDGNVLISGSPGDYSIVAQYGGASVSSNAHISQGLTNSTKIKMRIESSRYFRPK